MLLISYKNDFSSKISGASVKRVGRDPQSRLDNEPSDDWRGWTTNYPSDQARKGSFHLIILEYFI